MNIHKLMKPFGTFCVMATAAIVSAAVPASRTAVTPGIINYQGRLTDPNGDPYSNGVYTIEFRLYEAATGSGAGLWGCAYSVYIKDGYFNVMLGGTGGSALTNTPTYGPTELWKALWYDSAAPAKANDRYLGIKVTSGDDPALPDPPVEAFPRQRLLSAPFAERAQMANYARAAIDTFTIPSTLTVSGTVTAAGAVTVRGAATLTNTTVNGTLTVNGALTANNAQAVFNKGVSVNGAKTCAKQGLEVSGGAAELKGGATVNGTLTVSTGLVKAQGGLEVTGGQAKAKNGLEVSGGALNLLGDLTVAGSKAIVVRQYHASNTEDYTWDTGFPITTWSAMMVGFSFGTADIDEDDEEATFMARMERGWNGNWFLHYRGHYHKNLGDPTIDAMFIRRELVDDNR